jgi:hypothetical protein
VVGGTAAWSASCKNILTRRANQGHICSFPQFVKRHGRARQRALRRDYRQKILTPIEVAPARAANDRLRVAEPRALYEARARGDIDVNPVPELNKTTAMAATGQTRAAAAPRVKLSPRGFAIDHPDPEHGDALMADALGVSDRDAMHGILTQLVKASVNGEKPDAVNLAFMISMVKSIKPRDAVEAMLVAQMVSVHVMAMRCVHHLANAEDIARQDSAARALGRLARTFPAQIEALNRYRNHGEPAITVQNVSVGDGGNAIVGNVTQHANVLVSDKDPTPAVTDSRMVSMPDCSARKHDPVDAKRDAQA